MASLPCANRPVDVKGRNLGISGAKSLDNPVNIAVEKQGRLWTEGHTREHPVMVQRSCDTARGLGRAGCAAGGSQQRPGSVARGQSPGVSRLGSVGRDDLDHDRRRDVREQLDHHLVGARRLDRLTERDGMAIELDALLLASCVDDLDGAH